MSGRRTWTTEAIFIQEDEKLAKVVEDCGVHRWPLVAYLLRQRYGIRHRTPKQCKERWTNCLSSMINNQSWTQQEEVQLIALYVEYGAKWKFIAANMPGRPENVVKNHFYSRVRRAIRTLPNCSKPSIAEFLASPMFLSQFVKAALLPWPEEKTDEEALHMKRINRPKPVTSSEPEALADYECDRTSEQTLSHLLPGEDLLFRVSDTFVFEKNLIT